MIHSLALNSHEQAAAGYADGPARIYRDEAIFRRGEVKTHLYFIEAGTVRVYETARGSNTVVEFAFAGDTVGFGLFDRHSYTAQAVGEVRLMALPLSALEDILTNDKRALQRYAEALQREFELRRTEVVRGERRPASRVAALFLALSHRIEEEGHDAHLIADSLECGTVARYLDLDIDALGEALIELERMDLIELSTAGLRLTDMAGLERLSTE